MPLNQNEIKVNELLARQGDLQRQIGEISELKNDEKKVVDTKYNAQLTGFYAQLTTIRKKLEGIEDLDA